MTIDPESDEVEEGAAVLSVVDSTLERTKRDLPRRKSLALQAVRRLAFCPGMTATLGFNGLLKNVGDQRSVAKSDGQILATAATDY